MYGCLLIFACVCVFACVRLTMLVNSDVIIAHAQSTGRQKNNNKHV